MSLVHVTMDGDARCSALGFKPQKEIAYNKFLPYAHQLDEESQLMLQEIKTNLGLSVMMRELRPGCGMWTARLKKYIKFYGLKFSKEDHLSFIQLVYELITIPNLEPYLVSKFSHLLITLLKKKELISPEELILPWRPLYDLCKRIFSSSRGAIGMYRYFSSLEITLDSLVHAARFYFPASATEEMLNEWRPLLCPYDRTRIGSTLETMEWFLPIALPPSLSDKGYKLWFQDMMELWEVCNNAPSWECDMMWLIARLARCNIGYIDWEPYIPLIFTRFLRSLNLPVSYKLLPNSKTHKLDTSAMALWIVSVLGGGSSAQKHLDKFMRALESYFHPANVGRWVFKLSELLSKLPLYFVQRLNFERYKKASWETPVPESYKLTEEDITKFVLSVKPVALQAMYSKMGIEVSQAMQHLATLRPQIIIPEIVDSVYSHLETVSQPLKFQAALQCLIAVIRPMAEGGQNNFKEGPTHIIPLLFSVLPGIDPNDIRKCFVTLHFVSTVANMVPFVDCSKAAEHYKNLTEEEESICLATASFEDFVLQFLDRCFVLVESSSLESTRLERENDRRSRIENLAQNSLAATCVALFTQTSPSIFKAALKKLHSFVMGRILETKVAGHFLAAMCRSFAKVNGEETLRIFVPCLSDNILTLTDSEEILKEESLDNELLYNFLILSEIVDCPGKYVLPHIPVLRKVLDRTLHLTCREGYTLSARLLLSLVSSLCTTFPLEFRSVPHTFDENVKEYLPIREWGKAGNLHHLQMNWYVPGKEEVNCVKEIVDSYLCPEIKSIEQFIDNPTSMKREELHRALGIFWSILSCKSLLPHWDETPLILMESCLESSPFISTAFVKFEHNDGITVNNMNVRKVLVSLMDRLQNKLLECKEDDTVAFFNIINIWECLLMNVHEDKPNFEARWKRFHLVKRILENKLVGGKLHLRPLLIDRVLLQHELLLERGSCCITPTHKLIMDNLMTLSISQYSEVRARAQSRLFVAMEMFPHSYLILIDKLVENLKKDSVMAHEEFKGALYLLLGPKQNPVVARHDWYVLNSLWPAIVKAKPSEKISVIRLLDNVVDIVHKQFPTITINLKIPDSCEAAGCALWASGRRECSDIKIQTLINEGKHQLELKNKYNLEQYLSLLHSLNDAIEHENLHWRFHAMALSFLRDLVHPDVAYPPEVVKCFLNTLVNDSLELRKIAIRGVIFLLKQQKRTQKKIKINPSAVICKSADTASIVCPGNRPDNQWVQFKLSCVPKTPEEWNKPQFAHRPYHGFYAWPKELEVYEQLLDPPPLMMDLPNEKEQEVKDFFSKPDNVIKLMCFLTLEEKKGKDKFNAYKYLMFKGLFRNGGSDMFKIFAPRLEELVCSKLESHQRCAAEIIAGAIRGSKHWPFDMVKSLWDYLTPLIRSALTNMTEETITDWGVCYATASENMDPRRNYLLFEVLMEEAERNESSFIECGRLYALQGALNQQVWRMSEVFNLWLERLKPFLAHPFQNVRERVGSVLNNIFECDLKFPKGNPSQSPHISDFVEFILPQLSSLYNVCPDTVDSVASVEKVEDSAIRLLKTVCKWISACVTRSNSGIAPYFYQLLPIICLMESYESDEELSRSCTCVLLALGQTIHVPHNVDAALTAILKVSQSTSWQVRATCLEFLQVFVFNNMPVILSSQEWISEVNDIVLRLMEDEWLDVRVMAAKVLGGLLHTGFIEEPPALLNLFKQKASVKMNKTKTRVDAASLRLRHAGVLGLCAFINAHPYDVPEFIPDLFVILGQHLNDPQPVPSTIRKTLGDFKRTHHDNWPQHSLKFTEAQLTVLGDLTIPPSYYA